ncbi:sugar transferase [Verrucosispora sp. WMMD1129]|uniref:sugar transferase n=1 Tax=Verrucosispora sp. WMMD1129 TaxID=3016093 RepID=UPI00249A133C|nr:sugar transferase [Verrucosispora sp. WMMD1129]WFE48487.1 sugar transferase [Verrucosispora sp. WMMD1129]
MQRRVKRVLDVVTALVVLTLAAPVIAVASLLIQIQLGAPVFFVQERCGWRKKPFKIMKLRTMSDERDADGNLLPDSIRCRGIGRVLRRLSIDELPQLVNVIKGDLSLVGPRPLLTRYNAWYTERERRRFEVRPGITGLAQISGRNGLPWNERLALDVRYVDEWSLWLDLRILVATIGKVSRANGVALDPGAEMLDLDKERQLTCTPS